MEFEVAPDGTMRPVQPRQDPGPHPPQQSPYAQPQGFHPSGPPQQQAYPPLGPNRYPPLEARTDEPHRRYAMLVAAVLPTIYAGSLFVLQRPAIQTIVRQDGLADVARTDMIDAVGVFVCLVSLTIWAVFWIPALVQRSRSGRTSLGDWVAAGVVVAGLVTCVVAVMLVFRTDLGGDPARLQRLPNAYLVAGVAVAVFALGLWASWAVGESRHAVEKVLGAGAIDARGPAGERVADEDVRSAAWQQRQGDRWQEPAPWHPVAPGDRFPTRTDRASFDSTGTGRADPGADDRHDPSTHGRNPDPWHDQPRS